jgi:hypothetical protein
MRLRRVGDRLDGVDLDLLLAITPSGKWAQAFLYSCATSPQTTLEQQLNALARVTAVRIWENHEDSGAFELTYAARGVGRVWEGVATEERTEDRLGPQRAYLQTPLAASLVAVSTSGIGRASRGPA